MPAFAMEVKVNCIEVLNERDAACENQVHRASVISGMPVFKFRARREAVDWRRISAVDVDRLTSGLDYQTLQEHLMGVTFCNLEHERCTYCQIPVDSVLLKLFRLAQLTIEYLLHSQDFLTQKLQATEDGLQASAKEKEQVLKQVQKQALDAKSLKEELKQRKKIIASQQQSMIDAGMGGYYKCLYCDKAFLNDSFLQSHMQRRHPEEYDIRLTSEQLKEQAVKLQDVIDQLNDQLNLARSQLETQEQSALKASQEQRSKEEDMLKRLERWKEEERERLSQQREMILRESNNLKKELLQYKTQVKEQQSKEEDTMKRLERWKEEERERLSQQMREMFLKESSDLKMELLQYKTQVKFLSELQETGRNFRSQQEQLQASSKERHREDVRKLEQRLKEQEKWVLQYQKSQDEHERERNKLQEDIRRLLSASEEEEANWKRLEKEMSWKLQEQRELISSQREQIRQLSVNPPIRAAEPARDTELGTGSTLKNRNLGRGYLPPCRTSGLLNMRDVTRTQRILEPATELTEEEEDSPSVSERTPEVKQQPPVSALKKDPGLNGQVERALAEKLESLGIREGVNRITKGRYTTAMAELRAEKERMAKKFPDDGRLPDEQSRALKARGRDADGGSTPQQLSRAKWPSDEVTQTWSSSGSPPSRITLVLSRSGCPSVPQHHPPRHTPQHPPQAAPRTKSSTFPESYTPRSVESESFEEESEEEGPSPRQGPSWGQSPQPKNRSIVIKVMAAKSASESSDGSVMEDPRQLQRYGEQNGTMGKASKGLCVKDLQQSPTRRLQDQSQRQPPGGVPLQPAIKEVVRETVQKHTKIDEYDEDDVDDWDLSSLEDEPLAHKQDTAVALKKSQESNTSASPKGKGQDGGLCVKDLQQSPARRLQDQSLRRPPGGVALQPAIKEVVRETVQKHTKIYEDDDDDWDLSFLEDEPSARKQDTAVALKKSQDSNTSASPKGKGQDGGLCVKDLQQSPARRLQDQSQRWPPGGVPLQPANKEVVRKTVQKRTKIYEDDDDDWDLSFLEDEPSARKQDTAVALKKSRDSNASASPKGKGQDGGLCVKDLQQSPTRRLQDQSQRRPPGGVPLQPAKKEVVRKTLQKLTKIYKDDDDDWDLSSLEDEPSARKQDTAVALKKSQESNTSASPKGRDRTEKGGTNSTLKSSDNQQMIMSDRSDDSDSDF